MDFRNFLHKLREIVIRKKMQRFATMAWGKCENCTGNRENIMGKCENVMGECENVMGKCEMSHEATAACRFDVESLLHCKKIKFSIKKRSFVELPV